MGYRVLENLTITHIRVYPSIFYGFIISYANRIVELEYLFLIIWLKGYLLQQWARQSEIPPLPH